MCFFPAGHSYQIKANFAGKNLFPAVKILIVLPRIPFPLEKGDKLRAFHQIKVLSRDHELYLVASGRPREVTARAFDELEPWCREVRFFRHGMLRRLWFTLYFFLRGRPLQCGYFYSSAARSYIRRVVKEKGIDHIYCQLFRTAEMVRGVDCESTIDYQDAFSGSMKKRMQATSGLKRWLLWVEYKRIRRYESRIYSMFDHHTIISSSDAKVMDTGPLVVVPNGVDTDFFKPVEGKEKVDDLIFTGNMSYLPNVHTSLYLSRKVMPVLWSSRPGVGLVLAGASPDRRVQQLQSSHITVTGWLDDIRMAYARAKVFIAPMHIGTGLQNKILEAMAMGLPVITSPSAAGPIGATHDQELMVAENAQQYATLAIELLDNEQKRKEMGQAARQFVINHFNWTACTRQLERLITQGSIQEQSKP